MSTGTVDTTVQRGAFATLAHGVRLTPEFARGLPVTLFLAVLATAGRIVVPIAVQQTIDHGLLRVGGPDLPLVRRACLSRCSWRSWPPPGGSSSRSRSSRRSTTACCASVARTCRWSVGPACSPPSRCC